MAIGMAAAATLFCNLCPATTIGLIGFGPLAQRRRNRQTAVSGNLFGSSICGRYLCWPDESRMHCVMPVQLANLDIAD